MGFDVGYAVRVAAPSATVWRLLVDVATWKSWWPDCLSATTADARTLHEGSRLELVLQPKHGRHTLRPVVDLITEGKTLSMTSRGPLLQATVSWHLHDDGEGTRLNLHGAFTGPAALVLRLLRADDVVRFSLHGNLRGLKKVAERLG
ncbi:MAG: hypothetical protein D6696_12215 [Acidobacteria bacterium]|nr:MAG: hypothetical protein D6696_12215 [Acidobacteriota bacterium]